MRVLYPSAHHDRFSHSLGVFYLGNLLFTSIKENSEKSFDFAPVDWERYQKSFEIACLMHDCAHAPFSHTFENYYIFQRGDEIIERISKYFNDDPDFLNDYKSGPPQPHELISALVLLEKYYDKVIENNADPKLCARMIMGCQYLSSEDKIKKFSNRLIMLLNGASFDVDSLDYIQRDTWASGVSNANIDYSRLLKSVMISHDEHGIPILTLKKQALSVLSSISQGRNFLYKWIYSHNKVLYEQNLLKKAVEYVNSITNGEYYKKVFSIEAFYEPQIVENREYYLTSDDDIYSSLKNISIHVMKLNSYSAETTVIKPFGNLISNLMLCCLG